MSHRTYNATYLSLFKHTNCFSFPEDGDGGAVSPPTGRQVKSLKKRMQL